MFETLQLSPLESTTMWNRDTLCIQVTFRIARQRYQCCIFFAKKSAFIYAIIAKLFNSHMGQNSMEVKWPYSYHNLLNFEKLLCSNKSHQNVLKIYKTLLCLYKSANFKKRTCHSLNMSLDHFRVLFKTGSTTDSTSKLWFLTRICARSSGILSEHFYQYRFLHSSPLMFENVWNK